MIRKAFTFLCSAMFILNCQAAKLEGHFQNFVVFGDSLSDVGNNTWVISNEGVKGTPIVNVDEATGKKQNWVAFFNDKVFPNQKLYTYAQAQSLKNPSEANIDMAFASAETGSNYLNDKGAGPYPPYDTFHCEKPGLVSPTQSCIPGIERQIQLYLSMINRKVSPHTLFIIWAGGNDLFNNVTKLLVFYNTNHDKLLLIKGFTTLFTGSFFSEGIRLSHPIANLQSGYDELIAAGASPSQIIVMNLPDIGISPAAKQFIAGNPELSHLFTLMTLNFNSRLKIALWSAHVFSTYQLLNQVLSNPSQYGFINTQQSCLAAGQAPYCKGYLFYNSKHPTAALGQILADRISQVIN